MSNPKDMPDFEYVCSEGHSLAANHRITLCPACVHGEPCQGTLTRVGKGSKIAAAAS